ncbi:hypothetical protein [Microbulbifer sp. TYP-18]|uniref:hypothetical protein n=1 Tax=Microbulbifer sp. TYP-18 TaxID=3230024 RepID=UPI0034C606A7
MDRFEHELEQQDSELGFDRWLGQQLQFNEPYLENDGFCEAVMSQLPSPVWRRERRVTRMQYGAVLVASAIVAWQFPFEEVLGEAARQSVSLYGLVGAGIVASLVVMAGGIVAARR